MENSNPENSESTLKICHILYVVTASPMFYLDMHYLVNPMFIPVYVNTEVLQG